MEGSESPSDNSPFRCVFQLIFDLLVKRTSRVFEIRIFIVFLTLLQVCILLIHTIHLMHLFVKRSSIGRQGLFHSNFG
jgi:hypothetical protein